MWNLFSSFIYNYYPTSTLGDKLSTCSGTWVVVKSKIEKVPRGIRCETFSRHSYIITTRQVPSGTNCTPAVVHVGSGKKQNRESTKGYSMWNLFSSFIYNYYPTSTLGDKLSTCSGTWVVVKSKIEKVPRGIRCETFSRHSYIITTRQVPSGTNCPPAVVHG